jgi:hypothetical protein
LDEAEPPLEISAVRIIPRVAERGEEGGEQIPVRPVKLNGVKAGGLGN